MESSDAKREAEKTNPCKFVVMEAQVESRLRLMLGLLDNLLGWEDVRRTLLGWVQWEKG